MLEIVMPEYCSAPAGSVASGLAVESSEVDIILCLKGHALVSSGDTVSALLSQILRHNPPVCDEGAPQLATRSVEAVLYFFGFQLIPYKLQAGRCLLKLKHLKTGVAVHIWCDPCECGLRSEPLPAARARVAICLTHASAGLLSTLYCVWCLLAGTELQVKAVTRPTQYECDAYSVLLLIENYLAQNVNRQINRKEDTEGMVGAAFLGLLDHLGSLATEGSLITLNEPANMLPPDAPAIQLDFCPFEQTAAGAHAAAAAAASAAATAASEAADCSALHEGLHATFHLAAARLKCNAATEAAAAESLHQTPLALRMVPQVAQQAAAAIRKGCTLEDLLQSKSPVRKAFVEKVLNLQLPRCA
jgi:hypothetical protein